jgi:polar amino acid transport system substrate-binding protein
MSAAALVRSLILTLTATTLVAEAGCRQAVDNSDPKSKPLIWAADKEGGAPYVFTDPKNPSQVVGFEKDIADALAKEMGRPIEFKQYQFEQIVPGLERGDFDFGMNGLEITADRKAKIRFSRPYYIYRLQLVARAGEMRFTNLKELKEKKLKVGTLEDTAALRLLKKEGIEAKAYSDSVVPYQDLKDGQVDAVLQDLPIAIYLVQKNDGLKDKLKFVGEPIEPGQYAIAFSPKNEAMAKDVDKALDKLIKDGTLKKIYEKWELWNDDQKDLEKAK